ncbi:MAG: 3-oxoacyl-[acyl-carrier-protein] synthase [Actinomycetota bacterium]|nr:3-oxoacyl-[acyl-carrier-protein] synthase [Actinomycetota bacterium]
MSVIAGVGMAVPEQRVTNADFEARLDTTDAWITERTGIKERRVAADGEKTRDLAVAAGAAALKDAGLTPDDVGLLVLATATPDQALPATAAFVQDELGTRGGAFDLGAACAGFVYGLVVASSMLANLEGSALVIGAETLTRIVDPDDRSTAVLFGDGAGAAVLLPSVDGRGLLAWDMGCDGSAAGLLEIRPGESYLRMDGREVFRRAVRVVVESAEATLRRAGMSASQVDVFVPHQANRRIIDAAASRLGIPEDRTVVNVDRYGNTSAASIPIALAEAAADGRLQDGQLVLLSGFGAGMTWASALIRWGS